MYIYILWFTLWNCHSESHFNKNGSLIGFFAFGGMIVVVAVIQGLYDFIREISEAIRSSNIRIAPDP